MVSGYNPTLSTYMRYFQLGGGEEAPRATGPTHTFLVAVEHCLLAVVVYFCDLSTERRGCCKIEISLSYIVRPYPRRAMGMGRENWCR